MKQLRCPQCRQVTRGDVVASWWIWPEPQGDVHHRKLGDWDIAARMAICSYLGLLDVDLGGNMSGNENYRKKVITSAYRWISA